MSLRDAVLNTLEAITDPCSMASGAPAGLVSMGLVGDIKIEDREGGAHVDVTLFVTEPGCMMSALFQITAQRDIELLRGVASVAVRVDYGHVWGPEQMAPEYRRRLAEYRTRQSQHMKSLQLSPNARKERT